MATMARFWLLASCLTLLYVRNAFPKIVEGTLSTTEVKHISLVVYRDISSRLLRDEIPAIKIIRVNFAYSCYDLFDRTGPS